MAKMALGALFAFFAHRKQELIKERVGKLLGKTEAYFLHKTVIIPCGD